MWRRVVLAGLVGWVAMLVIVFMANGFYGFRARIDFNQLDNETLVYETLKQNISVPGRYICNPPLTTSGVFPGGEPVYSIFYSGIGHEAASREQRMHYLSSLLLTMIVAALLSMTSVRVLSSYGLKLLFVALVGLLLAISGNLAQFGIGGYPFDDVPRLGLFQVALWLVLGLIMAGLIRPSRVR